MIINLFTIDNSSLQYFAYLCNQSNKFKFEVCSIDQFLNFQDMNNIIIIKKNTKINLLKRQIESTPIISKKNLFFLVSNSDHYSNLINNYNVIKYPIKFISFEKILINSLKSYKINNIVFKNFELKFDNTLYNNHNNKFIHLTEIESKIIKLLFFHKKLKKDRLNSEVLNFSPDIDSKSLDSHLYRLRKKLYKLDKNTKIVISNDQYLKII